MSKDIRQLTKAGVQFYPQTHIAALVGYGANGKAIDDEPTAGSDNLVKSEGAFFKPVYDHQKGCIIAYNHVISMDAVPPTTISWVQDSSYDCFIIPIANDTQYVKCDTGDIEFTPIYRYLKKFDIDNLLDNYITTNSTGLVPDGANVCVAHVNKETRPDTYEDIINIIQFKQESHVASDMRTGDMAANKGFYIDKDHLMNLIFTPGSEVAAYIKNNLYDCAIIFTEGAKEITLHGISNTAYYRFFDSADIFNGENVYDSYISGNQTGKVPDGAVVCLVVLTKSNYSEGYNSFYLERTETRGVLPLVEPEIKTVNKGFYIDKNHTMDLVFTPGSEKVKYIASNGWDLCVIYLEGCSAVKLHGIVSGANYRFYNSADIFNGENVYESYIGNNTTGVVPVGAVVCTLSLNHSVYTDGYESFCLTKEYQNEHEKSAKKKIRMLLLGNSATDDAMSYVPFIMQNMGVDVEYQIGIAMMSSSTLENHVENFENETAAYWFELYTEGGAWQYFPGKTIQWMLDNYEWDIIVCQQASNTTTSVYQGDIQPWLNKIANLVSAYVDYNVKFVYYLNQTRPSVGPNRANWTDEEVTNHYLNSISFVQKIMQETIFEKIIPVGTAIQNARTIPSLKAMGDYASASANTSGLGYLTQDGVHLQEGLPCQIAAYTFALAILDIYGFKEYSINGETTRVTSDWTEGKSIPSPHGEPVGSTDANCLMAQKCAIMAIKKPFEVTDMSYIINPTGTENE